MAKAASGYCGVAVPSTHKFLQAIDSLYGVC
jgi:hypothetical protein